MSADTLKKNGLVQNGDPLFENENYEVVSVGLDEDEDEAFLALGLRDKESGFEYRTFYAVINKDTGHIEEVRPQFPETLYFAEILNGAIQNKVWTQAAVRFQNPLDFLDSSSDATEN